MKKKYIQPVATLIVLEAKSSFLVTSKDDGKEITGSAVTGDMEFVGEAPGDNDASDDDDDACAKHVGYNAWTTWDE